MHSKKRSHVQLQQASEIVDAVYNECLINTDLKGVYASSAIVMQLSRNCMLKLWKRKLTIFVMEQIKKQKYNGTLIISAWAGRSVMEGLRRLAGDTDSESILLK